MAGVNLNAGILVRLGAELKAVRRKARLTQTAVCRAMGVNDSGARTWLHRLEHGSLPSITFMTVVRYLRACNAPVGGFMLELAQAGVFGEAERSLAAGLPAHPGLSDKLRPERRAEQKARQREREQRDSEMIALLWREVMPQIQRLLPAGQPHFMSVYLGGVERFYKAWKRANRAAKGMDSTAMVNAAFDTVEQAGIEHRLVPAAVRRMREVIFDRLRVCPRSRSESTRNKS